MWDKEPHAACRVAHRRSLKDVKFMKYAQDDRLFHTTKPSETGWAFKVYRQDLRDWALPELCQHPIHDPP